MRPDRDRLLTLLSVAKNRPMTADILNPIEAAADYWQRGEQKTIIDALNTILGRNPEDHPMLKPFPFRNYPHDVTGAQFYTNVSGYTSFYVWSPGSTLELRSL